MGASEYANASNINLTLNTPECKTAPGNPLPEKYYVLATKFSEFNWAKDAKKNDLYVNGNGIELINGSGLYTWYSFDKLDINGDGWCDWFVTYLAPYSSGAGGASGINTLYLGSSTGWKRIGARVPSDKPDAIGWGNDNQQASFAFSSETPLIISDETDKKNYLIGRINSRDDFGVDRMGYQVYTWDKKKNTLTHLNKWLPGSVAYQVYAYFKQHGAIDPTKEKSSIDRIVKFNPEIEKRELSLKCGEINGNTNYSYLIKPCKDYINNNKTK